MSQEIKGMVYDIQGFSVQDGPGIRTTVFLKGCPLRCPWCHSPESQMFPTELNWMQVRCLGTDACGKCLDVCPKGAISIGESTTNAMGEPITYPDVDKTLCDDCGACANACKATALYMCGEDKTVDEVMHRLLRDQPFFDLGFKIRSHFQCDKINDRLIVLFFLCFKRKLDSVCNL